MHVQNAREVPEYEIDASELDFTNSVCITKVKLSSFLVMHSRIFVLCSFCIADFI